VIKIIFFGYRYMDIGSHTDALASITVCLFGFLIYIKNTETNQIKYDSMVFPLVGIYGSEFRIIFKLNYHQQENE